MVTGVPSAPGTSVQASSPAPAGRDCSVSSTRTSSNSDWNAAASHTFVAATRTVSVMRLESVPPW